MKIFIINTKFNLNNFFSNIHNAGHKDSLFSINIRINKNFYHNSNINYCYWRTLLNKLSYKDNVMKMTENIQYLKINQTLNKAIKSDNIKIIEYYYCEDKSINKLQYEALLANNNKEYMALQHRLLCIKLKDENLCIAETSNLEGNIRRSLNKEELLNIDISLFHKADKLKIKECNGKFYVLAFRKFGNSEAIYAFKEAEILNPLDSSEIQYISFFLNENLEELKTRQIDMNNYCNTIPLLNNLVNSNIENKLINNKKIIDLYNIDKSKGEY